MKSSTALLIRILERGAIGGLRARAPDPLASVRAIALGVSFLLCSVFAPRTRESNSFQIRYEAKSATKTKERIKDRWIHILGGRNIRRVDHRAARRRLVGRLVGPTTRNYSTSWTWSFIGSTRKYSPRSYRLSIPSGYFWFLPSPLDIFNPKQHPNPQKDILKHESTTLGPWFASTWIGNQLASWFPIASWWRPGAPFFDSLLVLLGSLMREGLWLAWAPGKDFSLLIEFIIWSPLKQFLKTF